MGRVYKVAALLLAGSMLTGAGPRTGAGSVDAQRIVNARSEPGNWLTHGGSYAEQRFADLGQINAHQRVDHVVLARHGRAGGVEGFHGVIMPAGAVPPAPTFCTSAATSLHREALT